MRTIPKESLLEYFDAMIKDESEEGGSEFAVDALTIARDLIYSIYEEDLYDSEPSVTLLSRMAEMSTAINRQAEMINQIEYRLNGQVEISNRHSFIIGRLEVINGIAEDPV